MLSNTNIGVWICSSKLFFIKLIAKTSWEESVFLILLMTLDTTQAQFQNIIKY